MTQHMVEQPVFIIASLRRIAAGMSLIFFHVYHLQVAKKKKNIITTDIQFVHSVHLPTSSYLIISLLTPLHHCPLVQSLPLVKTHRAPTARESASSSRPLRRHTAH